MALGLQKLGIPEIIVWDGDKVEIHNVPSQLFRTKDIGQNKSEALLGSLEGMGEEDIIPVQNFWDGEPLEGIVISAVDTMEVRKKIWESIKFKPSVPLFIDGRIGGEAIKVLAKRPSDPDDIKEYERSLIKTEGAPELPCTARAVIDVSLVIAGLIVRCVRGYLKEGTVKTYIASMHNPEIHCVEGG